MITIILILVICLCTWYSCVRPLSHFTRHGINQTQPWPLIGDHWRILFRKNSPAEFVAWVYNLFPDKRYSGFYQFTTPIYVIRDPELIRQITVKDFDCFTDHQTIIDLDADKSVGRMLFFMKNQAWRQMRQQLTKAFNSNKMRNMFDSIVDVVRNVEKHVLDKDKHEDVLQIEVRDVFTRICNDMIARLAFGIDINSLSEPQNSFYQMGQELASFGGFVNRFKLHVYLLIPVLFKLCRIGLVSKRLKSYFQNILVNRGEEGLFSAFYVSDENQCKNGTLTIHDITSQAMMFFFAGLESVSNVMVFGAHELVLNPDIQNKLRNEIVETHRKAHGKLTYDDLARMEYLGMVVSEMLRKYPNISTGRVCTKPYTIEPINQEKPLNLKVGTIINIPIYGIHRDPQYYKDPDIFDPERFSSSNTIKPCTFIPFGSGPRICLGYRLALLEIKLLFYFLLLNFQLVPIERTVLKLGTCRKSITNAPACDVWIGLKRL